MINHMRPPLNLRKTGAEFCAAVLVLAAASAASAGLFGPKEIASTWNAAATVEGTEAGWYEFGLTEKEGLAVAVSNDNMNLYVYAAASDRDLAAQLSGKFNQTFTVWLDGRGGKKKVYGIRLEVKPGKEPKEARPEPPKAQSGEKKKTEEKEIPYLAVIVDKKGPISSLEADGAAFRSGFSGRSKPMFEFKFPLNKVLPGGGLVGIGFETSKIDDSVLAELRRAEGGVIGGGDPFKSGRHKGKIVSSGPSLPEPIDFWLKVRLASKP